MIHLETERLILRNFTSEDWRDLAELAMRYEQTDLAKYDEGPRPEELEEYKNIVLDMAKGDDFVAVVLKASRKLIGLVFKGQKQDEYYEFGFNFNTNYQGRGFALESCERVLEFIFQILKAEKVSAGTAKLNKKSVKLMERLGFLPIRDKIIAFRKDAAGNPIEFEAIDFLLTKEDWYKEKKRMK